MSWFVDDLNLQDRRCVDAAQGWLGLANWIESARELDAVSSENQNHPEVLQVRYEIFAFAKQWDRAADIARTLSEVVPHISFGWIQYAYCLHEMGRTEDAWNALLPVAEKFPDKHVIPYNLACYACQLGKVEEAWLWLTRTVELIGKKELQQMALDDPDLKPLWNEIKEI